MLLIQNIFRFFSSLLLFQYLTRLVPGEFTTPPDVLLDLTYQRGSLIQLAWNSTLRRVALTLWHESGNDFEYLRESFPRKHRRSPTNSFDYDRLANSKNITNTNSYPWMVGSSKDISSNTFRFIIYDPGNTTLALESNTFQITDTFYSASATQVTSSTSISTATVVTTTSSISPNSATPTAPSSISDPTRSLNPTRSPNATLSAKSELRTVQKTRIGIGIGIGIGVPLLLAMGIVAGWKFRVEQIKFASSRYQPSSISTPLTAMTNAQPTNSQEIHELNQNPGFFAPPT